MKKFIINTICYSISLVLIWFSIQFTFYIIYPYCYAFEKSFDQYWWVRVFENPKLSFPELWVYYNQQLFFSLLATITLILSLVINHFVKKYFIKVMLHYIFIVVFIPLWYMAILPTSDLEGFKTNKEIVDFTNIIIMNLWMVILLIFNFVLYGYIILKGVNKKLSSFWAKSKIN